MRAAMASAAVGDDVWGDDPTVTELETETAALLGKAAAVYVPSGTQSNLCALMAHCARGDEYIVGENAHTFRYEAGGAAVLGSIQPQPVRTLPDGSLDLDHVESVIKPDNPHFARSRVLCLENTHDGKVLSLDHQADAAALATERGLSLHLDGARLWNAAIALDVEPAVVAEPFDTVSVCLSKGLGAPVGSVLVGSVALVDEARRWRKMLGGGMRQAGIVAAGGLHAIRHNRARLADDHANAAHLATGLAAIDRVTVTGHDTNMVFAAIDADPAHIERTTTDKGVLLAVGGSNKRGATVRFVTHRDVSAAEIDTVLDVLGGAIAAE